MITNTPKHDHQKRVVLLSQLEKLCYFCGGHVFPHPDGVTRCVRCAGTEYTEVQESEAREFRAIMQANRDGEKVVEPFLFWMDFMQAEPAHERHAEQLSDDVWLNTAGANVTLTETCTPPGWKLRSGTPQTIP